MELGLQGKTALVTGATGGIGFAIAKTLAEEGATVYLNGRSQEKISAAIAKIGQVKGRLHSAHFDLETKSGSDALLKAIPAVDILVNNLGIYEVREFEDISDEDWLRIFNINVMSGIRLSRHYFPLMKKKDWGRVIFISSESAVNIPKEMIHYGVTKTAQIAVARGMAELTAGTKVTVNSVLVGPTYSTGVEQYVEDVAKSKKMSPKQVEEEFFKTVRPGSLIQRFATIDEIGNFVTFIASEKAAAINGAALRVEGGVVHSIL